MQPKIFRVKIYAYKYNADFNIECVESAENIENAIVDRLGKGDIKWEYLGEMNDPKVNRITYEEVINDARTSTGPIQTKEGSGSRMGAGAS
jgi:hypothetical protein